MTASFRPAWWLRHPHLQTIVPRFFRPFLRANGLRERLNTADNDFVDLVWNQRERPAAGEPIVIVLHGLEGSVRSFYAKGMLAALHRTGLSAVLMHFRNCSDEPNRQRRAYHSGETSDLTALIHHLQHQYPGSPLAAVGFSLGGNVLAKYLGHSATNSGLIAAAVVSAPYLLAESCQVLMSKGAAIYQSYLLGRLKRSTERKFRANPQLTPPLPLEQLPTIANLWQFDEQVTAPLHGFAGADDYYQQASSKADLKHIATPTLLIHAIDDPMLCPSAIPTKHDVSNCVELEISKRGGHVGFIAGRIPFWPEFWLERRIPNYFRERFARAKDQS